MDFLGGLLSGVSNLVGGFLNRSSAQSIAAQNIQEQMAMAEHGVTWRARDATRAQAETGINRLALLGVPTSSFSNITGDSGALGQGVANAGQDIGRAITAGNPQLRRQQELTAQLLEARIANVNADTVRQQAEASNLVRRFASAGTAPTVSVPLPRPAPWTENTLPGYTRFRTPEGGNFWGFSPEASQSFQNMGSVPSQIAPGMDLARLNAREGSQAITDAPVGSGVWRPDVGRYISDVGSVLGY